MDTAPAAPAFASVSEAMDMVHAGLSYLAAADTAQLAAQTQAECLRRLEQSDAISTAARASFLSVAAPAQIPACGITALGSYLGCVATKRVPFPPPVGPQVQDVVQVHVGGVVASVWDPGPS